MTFIWIIRPFEWPVSYLFIFAEFYSIDKYISLGSTVTDSIFFFFVLVRFTLVNGKRRISMTMCNRRPFF